MNTAIPTLFGTPDTVQAVERARAIVVLVGGYDGSGNYGDIAQFEAAMELVERLSPDILPLPVLERQYLTGHRLLNEGARERRPHALFFDPGSEGDKADELQPVAAPVELAFGGSYLYGGGYLNRLWGGRKLAMLDAAEKLLAAGGAAASCRLSSGLQVEPGWIPDPGSDDSSGIDRLDFLGARDADSRQALAALGGENAPALNTGDDAIAMLVRLPAANGAMPDDGKLRLNVHFAEHDWVTERPQEVLGYYTGFMAELGRRAGRPVVAQPVIAYSDPRIDERAGMDRFASACAAAGVGVAEPMVLRPTGLAEAAPRLRAASMTLSCSYHVALTSLMLEVPAILLGDNRYYEQKAAGLREDFGLPPAFTGSTLADPSTQAAELAAIILDERLNGELRDSLRAGVENQRKRRAATEAEFLGRLGQALATALVARIELLTSRVHDLATEPADLQVQLGTLRAEAEELRRQLEESPLEAELRVQDANARALAAEETLATVLRSRSWRLLEPLRQLRARLRRG